MRRLLQTFVVAVLLVLVLGAGSGCDPEHDGPATPPARALADPRITTAGTDAAGNGAAAPFRAFAAGGPAPAFDDQVDVSVSGTVLLTLGRDRAGDPRSWVDGSRSLLQAAADTRLRPPRTCRGLPSPVGPPLGHDVDVSGVAVLWRHRVCDVAVRLLIDQDGEIAAVAIDTAG